MSVHFACIFERGNTQGTRLANEVQFVLRKHGLETRLLSDETESFEEDQGPRRAAKVRQLEFPQFSMDIGIECCYIRVRKDWAMLTQEPQEFYRAESIGIGVAAASGSGGPMLIFPNSNLGYDHAQLLSYIATFDEIKQWFLSVHGPPTAQIDTLLVRKGPAVIGSGYRFVQGFESRQR